MQPQTTRFLLTQSLFLILSAILLLNFFTVAGAVDLKLITAYIDVNAAFPLRQHWALAELNHRYVKYVLIAVYLSYGIAWLMSFYSEKFKPRRWEFGYFFIMVMLATSTIAILKSQSAHACPWDMAVATTQGILWELSATAGHCFPGGHASSGFALLVGYFIYRTTRPKRAYFFLLAALILGFAMGWAQMMRGAHFLSHTLWTGWIIWGLNVMAYALFADRLVKAEKTVEYI
ncbi:phosphatase PAP2 family protein [Acinetobacter sp. NS4_7]